MKSIADTSLVVCDKYINTTDSVSTNKTSIISTKVASPIETNSDDKKLKHKMDCYIQQVISLN